MPTTTPRDARFGWLGPKAAERAFAKLGPTFPKFFIFDQTRLSEGRRMVLWDFAKKINQGRHLPTFRQEIGDCVSMGAANAVNYLAATEIAKLGDPEEYHPAFQPYIYGISRVQIGGGRLGNSDGSLGVWAADGVRKFGVLRSDAHDVPAYAGDIAKKWGKSGPPDAFVAVAKPHAIGTTAPVTTYSQVRDAIVNGYPVTVASMQGFLMKPRVDRGKSWGVPSGQWAHQMCFIGVDDDSARPGCYVLNSWGPDAHGQPADDAPPGGFWVDADAVERMAGQGDSFAYSQFDGFPEQALDFHVI